MRPSAENITIILAPLNVWISTVVSIFYRCCYRLGQAKDMPGTQSNRVPGNDLPPLKAVRFQWSDRKPRFLCVCQESKRGPVNDDAKMSPIGAGKEDALPSTP